MRRVYLDGIGLEERVDAQRVLCRAWFLTVSSVIFTTLRKNKTKVKKCRLCFIYFNAKGGGASLSVPAE